MTDKADEPALTDAVQAVIEALSCFTPDDETDNVWRLYQLFEGFGELPHREAAMPAMFALMERWPDAELGSPGPLVQELEAIAGYEPLLAESVLRQPTDLTVWMLNRILNALPEGSDHALWLARLQAASTHAKAPDFVRESAQHFLLHQRDGAPGHGADDH